MKKINRHNYEVFFIDYFDNELNKKEIQSLFDFLELHPDLKEEFEEFENFNISSDQEVVLANKPQLKKHIDESNIEHYIIAELEGQLTTEDQIEYTDFIAENSFYTPTVERYKRTILQQEVFSFPNKYRLKEKRLIVTLWPYATAIAAAILLLLTLNINDTTQEYHFQALKDINIPNRETISFKRIENTPNDTTKSIANYNNKNNISKKVSVFSKEIDSTFSSPKIKKQFKPLQKKSGINIKNEEIEKLNDNIALVENIAKTQNDNLQKKETIPTLKQTIHNTIRTKVFNDENNKNKLINKEYLIAAASDKVSNFSFEQTEKKERKKTRLRIGKFEFYRNKKA